jgi:hypothetical protein
MDNDKLCFVGTIRSVQPRIRMLRSFDERTHNYLGYSLLLEGYISEIERVFTIGIGKSTQGKYMFRIGDDISGECLPVAEQRLEPVEFYKVSRLVRTGNQNNTSPLPPPWETVPPDLETYRQRGHRRLSVRTYETKCMTCIWGCRMPVEIIIDNWDPGHRKYRFETFCYGPLSCRFYSSGAVRKVEGRNGEIWVEENWVDEDATSHRGPDE